MNILHIAEPFWGAWKIYGWEQPIPGIGINKELVDTAAKKKLKIFVQIAKDPQVYQISPVTVKNLAKKYHSLRTVRFSVKVYVVPQNAFDKKPEYEFIGNTAVLKNE